MRRADTGTHSTRSRHTTYTYLPLPTKALLHMPRLQQPRAGRAGAPAHRKTHTLSPRASQRVEVVEARQSVGK